MRMTLLKAQRELAILWFCFALAHALILFGQTYLGDVYIQGKEDLSKQAWQWWLPQVAPTLGLELGVLANIELVVAARRAAEERTVSKFFLRLTGAISSVYLLAILALELVVSRQSNAHERIALLQGASFLLGALQALIGAAFGVFFISSESAGPNPAGHLAKPPVVKAGNDATAVGAIEQEIEH